MFEHLLVPLDGSKLAEAALPFACEIAVKCESTITLLHIIESDAPAEVHGNLHLQEPAQAEEYLAKVKSKLLSQNPGLHLRKIMTHVHTEKQEDLSRSIVEHSREVPIDTILLTHHGTTGLRDRAVGSIAQQVIGLGKKPILLIHPDRRNNTFKSFRKILIPLDTDKDHAVSLKYGQFLAGNFSSETILASAIPTFGTLSIEESASGRFLPGATLALLDLEEEKLSQYLGKARDEYFSPSDHVRTLVLRGDPVRSILKSIQKNHVNLILLSSHGKAGWAAFWEGSFASSIITGSVRPMLIIPV